MRGWATGSIASAVRRRTGVAAARPRPDAGGPPRGPLELGLADRRFGYPLEMVLRAAQAGWRVAELDVPYRPRTGKSKVTGTVSGTLRTIRDMRGVLAA